MSACIIRFLRCVLLSHNSFLVKVFILIMNSTSLLYLIFLYPQIFILYSSYYITSGFVSYIIVDYIQYIYVSFFALSVFFQEQGEEKSYIVCCELTPWDIIFLYMRQATFLTVSFPCLLEHCAHPYISLL